VTRWAKGGRTVAFLIDRGRLESFEASDPAATAGALVERADRRLEATARAALTNGDADGAYAAAYDAYRMTGEALLARQLLRTTGGDGSHMAIADAVSAQFASGIPAFAKPAWPQGYSYCARNPVAGRTRGATRPPEGARSRQLPRHAPWQPVSSRP
jgi:hypothetical protein